MRGPYIGEVGEIVEIHPYGYTVIILTVLLEKDNNRFYPTYTVIGDEALEHYNKKFFNVKILKNGK